MALKHIRSAGPNDVSSYQLAGVPYVTSSAGGEVGTAPVKVTFPFVTRFFTVQNTTEHPLRIGFTENGINGSVTSNYLVLSGNQTTGRLELRCKKLYFRRDGVTNSGFSLIAGLTGISHEQFPVITGTFDNTGSFEGVG